MSAAPPFPPPPGPPSNSVMDGYDPGRPGMGSGSGDGGITGSNARRAGVMPHLSDLQAMAVTRTNAINPHSTMSHLLEEAKESAKKADFLLSCRRPDLAYVEYLVASEIVLNMVPRHKDAPELSGDRGRLYRLNKDLIKNLRDHENRFYNIKEIIKYDNKRSGVQPTVAASGTTTAARRPSTSAGYQNGAINYDEEARASLPEGPSKASSTLVGYERPTSAGQRPFSPSPQLSGRSTPVSLPDSPRNRPTVRPKPEGLQSRVVASGGTGGEDMIERFSKLRANGLQAQSARRGSRPASRSSDLPYIEEGPVKMPSPTDYNSPEPFSNVSWTSTSSNAAPTGRPSGPREMLNLQPPPAHPPKLPLDTHFVSAMPKAPSPTYSPARNMPIPASINPPRSTARSMVGTGGRSNSIAASSISSHPPGTNGTADSYFPNQYNGHPVPDRNGRIRRKSIHIPREYEISAQKLYDYMRMFTVLLIDVRSREEFDEGHIGVSSSCAIMCVEPTSLRPNMSAEELQDSLVLSPDIEQETFAQRNEFDLVVYFDQSTRSSSFLDGPAKDRNQVVLKYILDALYEFNEEKPLQRPPILLSGGMDAWTDLVGPQALYQSNTAPERAMKASRPIARVPMASSQSRIYIPKKRLRDYNPLDPEEEQKWAERARNESLAIEARPSDADGADGADDEDGTYVPIYHTTEEFLRRYPEAPVVEQQSMVSAPSRPPPPPAYQPPPIPEAPSRPAPAAPRVSYSGVHDRNSSSYHAVSRSSHLPSYIPASQLPQNVRLPRTGLINFGVTCYMNATIQALSATLPLTAIFKDGSYRNNIQRDNWKGSKGLLSEHYANLILNLWKGDVGACRPSTFRNFCARLNREWGLDRQQDAKEFFDFLIDFLHEDMNVNWNQPPPHVLSPKEEQTRERMPKPFAAKIEWFRYSKRERSPISDLFAGQHASRLRCTKCGFTSTTYEAFWSVSVEIPRSGVGDIYECLRSYCAEERLSGDEVWKCPNCKKEREATKEITITRAPRFLVVHFKRFSASHHESARKVRTPVDFPLNGLDMGPFMLPPPTAEEVARIAKEQGAQKLKEEYALDEPMRPPYIYNAYAVMRHIGNTLSSGHYISLVKDTGRNCWRQFNDDRTTDFDPYSLAPSQRLQNDQAYIVFYERVFPR